MVVISHTIGNGIVFGKLPFVFYGRASVSVFIVLSGYVLMLPVIRNANGSLPGGVGGFIKRRARRILPPYYAALVLGIIFHVIGRQGIGRAGLIEGLKDGNILTHVLLVHNFTQWFYGYCAPLWSVATEWQIYFIFAIILMPIWKRAGMTGLVVAAFIIGYLPIALFPHYKWAWFASPWFLALFGLGCWAAAINFSASPIMATLKSRLNWGMLFIAFTALMAASVQWYTRDNMVNDVLLGFAVACGLIVLTNASATKSHGIAARVLGLLEAKPLVFLGTFSYSIYLFHFTAMLKLPVMLGQLHLSHVWNGNLQKVLIVLIAVAASYVFHLLFERPFLSTHYRETQKTLAQHQSTA